MSQLAFSLRSRRRHPHAIASIAICGDPDGLGFLRVAPVSLSHQPSRGPSSVWFVGTLARAATASCCSFVSTIADSVACSILATVLLSLSSYSDYQLSHWFRLVSIIFKLLLYTLFSIRVTRLSPPSLSVIESSSLIGRAGKSSGRVTKIASCSSIYRVCADIVGESLFRSLGENDELDVRERPITGVSCDAPPSHFARETLSGYVCDVP